MERSTHDIVFTSAGLLSSAGDDLEKHVASMTMAPLRDSADAYCLKTFKPAPYLTDKRVLKSVSSSDALGIVAIEQLKKNAKLEPATYAAERVGLYVGAPPASAWNAADYFDAIRVARDDAGKCDPKVFGTECMSARPTTLLTGLPNNVLCYGSIILDSKGPNSNYTSGETSGQLAVINAARRISIGKLDAAVAGGFSAHGEPIVQSMLAQNGMLKVANGDERGHAIAPGGGGTITADGAFFYMLEKRDAAAMRNAKVLAEYVGGAVASGASGKFRGDGAGDAVRIAIKKCLEVAGVKESEIGLVMASASGIATLDDGERRAIDAIFKSAAVKPALGTTAGLWGNLVEAGGLGEIALIAPLYELGELPETLRLSRQSSAQIDVSKPYVLILRTSVFGEASCLLVRNAA